MLQGRRVSFCWRVELVCVVDAPLGGIRASRDRRESWEETGLDVLEMLAHCVFRDRIIGHSARLHGRTVEIASLNARMRHGLA